MGTLIAQVQKLRLGTKLVFGFLSVLLLAGLLGSVSLYQQRLLSAEFATIYEQDLLGIAAVEGARVDFAKLGRSLRQTILAPDGPQRQAGLALVRDARTGLARHLDDLRPRIVREENRQNLLAFEEQYRAYDRNVDTALQLLEGDQREAINFVSTVDFQATGQRADDALALISATKQDGAKTRMAAAVEGSDDTFRQLAALMVSGLALGAFFAWIVMRSIGGPVDNLRRAVEQVAKGQFDTEVVHTGDDNEIGDLARSIDVLRGEAKQMADQRWLKTHMAGFGAELQACDSLAELAAKFLSGLAPQLHIGMATIYAPGLDSGALRLLGSYGVADPSALPQSFQPGQGMVGQCAADQHPVLLEGPPSDYAKIASSLGSMAPAAVVVMPAIRNEIVLAVVELALIRPLDALGRELLEAALPRLAVNVEMIERSETTRTLLRETQAQAASIAASERQLAARKEELEQINDKLGQERAKTDAILEGSPDAMLIADHEGIIRFVNREAEAMFGFPRDKLIGMSVEVMMPSRVRGPHVGMRAAFVRAPENRTMGLNRDIVALRADGSEFPVEIRISPVVGEDLVTATVRDITLRKEQEAELRRAKQAAEDAQHEAEAATIAKSSFLATMSHEIRTPMNGVLAMAEMLEQTQLSTDQREMSKVIRGSAEGLMTILNDILDFSKIEAGRIEFEHIAIDLAEIVEDAAELVAGRADEKSLALIVDVQPGLPGRLLGDPTRIRQIVLNFLSNAVKFTAAGSITVRVSQPEAVAAGRATVLIEVEDTGIGMNEGQQARMFQAFTQADSSTSRKFGGTGLGLSITQRLAQLMGGEVGVRSAEGAGSTFWVRLTLAVAEVAPAAPSVAIADAPLTAIGFDTRARRAVASILQAAGLSGIRFADLPDPAIAPVPAGQRPILLVNAVSDSAALSRRLAARHPNARIIVAAPRAMASTLAAAPDSGAFDALTLPLRRSRVWLAIAAAQGKVKLAEARHAGTAGNAAFVAPELEIALAANAAVLVAEDNPTNQHVIKRVLDRAGFASRFTGNGVEALAALRSEPGYGLLLTDYHMPEMDGLELTRAIRAAEAANGDTRLPVIVLTADALAETGKLVADAGADGYLTKPMRYELVRAELERMLPAGAALRRAAGTEPPAEILIDRRVLVDTMGADDEESIRGALKFFWETAGEAPDEFDAAIKSGDAKAIREVAHAMKGTTASVGAAWLSEICKEAELAAKAGEVAQAAACAPRIRHGFARLGTYISTL